MADRGGPEGEWAEEPESHKAAPADGRRAIVLLAVAVLAARCSAARPENRPPAFGFHTDPVDLFRVVLPGPHWEVTTSTGSRRVPVAVVRTAASGGFRPNITIAVEPLARMLDAAEYTHAAVRRLDREGLTELEQGRFLAASNLYGTVHCLNSTVEPRLRHLLFLTVRGQKGYAITCTAAEGEFQALAQDFEMFALRLRFLEDL